MNTEEVSVEQTSPGLKRVSVLRRLIQFVIGLLLVYLAVAYLRHAR